MIGTSAPTMSGDAGPAPRGGAASTRQDMSARSGIATMLTVLLVSHMLEPLDCLAIEGLLDSDVLHRVLGPGAVPVLLTGGELHDVAGVDLLDRAALTLHEPAPEEHD